MAGVSGAHYTGKPPSGALTLKRLNELIESGGTVWMVFPPSTFEFEKSNGLPIKVDLSVKVPRTKLVPGRNEGPNKFINIGGMGGYWSDSEYLCYGFFGISPAGESTSAWGFENFWFALSYAFRRKM